MRVRAGEGAPPRPFQQAWRQKPGMSGSCRQASGVIYAAMLACLMHWYISMLYVVPVATVGGGGRGGGQDGQGVAQAGEKGRDGATVGAAALAHAPAQRDPLNLRGLPLGDQ